MDWKAIEAATDALGDTCEHDTPGGEAVYCALLDLMRNNGHEYLHPSARESHSAGTERFPPRGPGTCICADPENCTVPVKGCRAGHRAGGECEHQWYKPPGLSMVELCRKCGEPRAVHREGGGT